MTTEIMPINARGAIPVHLSTTLEISLSASDVMRWLDTVTDVETLRKISRYARKQADAIENPDDDDFRSRA